MDRIIEITKKIGLLILRGLRILFVKPFVWYFSLTVGKKIGVAMLTFVVLCLLVVTLPVAFYYAVGNGMFGKMPSDKDLQAIKSYQASEVYSSDSVLLGRYFVENRSDAKYEEVAKTIFDAIIATEDARFYEHKGVDTRSLLRVMFKSVILKQKTGGGSTLSQQLVKNVFGRKRYGWLTMPVNKVREIIIANQIEKLYSKKEILMLYVNTVSFGEDTYGIKTSSQRFFNTTPDKIKPEQAAVLAGMLKSPTAYNPRKYPDRALERRNLVLGQMRKYEYLSEKEFRKLEAQPLVLDYNRFSQHDGLAPYFREKVRAEVEQWLSKHPKKDDEPYNLYTDGLKIYTTLHYKLQKYAEQAVKEHLCRIQPALQNDLKANRFFKQNNNLVMDGIKKSKRYKGLEEQGLSQKEILKELQKPIKLTMFTQWGEKEMTISPLDSVRLMISSLQAGFLVLNPKNGQVLAYVGGADFEYFPYDHVMAQRQVGSTFKPIVYAEALRDGTQPCDFVSNQKVTYTQYDNWTPQNSEENYGGKYSMAGALANSVNTISVQLCMKSGIKKVIGLARALGIKSDLPEKPSIALGTADITLWELMEVYTAFANDGIKSEPFFISSVQANDGSMIYKPKPSSKRVLEQGVARQLTNMLRNVTVKGTAYELRERYGFSGDIAGKTGTTQDHRDAWFVGYTSRMVAGVWVGADNPAVHFNNMEQGKGSRMAMPVWANFYKRILKDRSVRYLASNFPYKNEIDCEMRKEDGFWAKLFKRKEKNSDDTGFENQPKSEEKGKKKKRFNWFRKKE